MRILTSGLGPNLVDLMIMVQYTRVVSVDLGWLGILTFGPATDRPEQVSM